MSASSSSSSSSSVTERENAQIVSGICDGSSSIGRETSYPRLLRVFRQQSKSADDAYAKLATLFTKAKRLPNGLSIRCFQCEKYQDWGDYTYLFHGTRSTLEVLTSGELRAYQSQSNHGIFFGRSYHTSSKYASERSTNINQTWNKSNGPVRSVLILNKDASPIETVLSYDGHYLLQQPAYSLSNLKAIVFITPQDVAAFVRYFDAQTPAVQERLRQLELYEEEYYPHLDRANNGEFKRILGDNVNELFATNYDFVQLAIRWMPFKGKHSRLVRFIATRAKDVFDDCLVDRSIRTLLAVVEMTSPDALIDILCTAHVALTKVRMDDLIGRRCNIAGGFDAADVIAAIFNKIAGRSDLVERIRSSIQPVHLIRDDERRANMERFMSLYYNASTLESNTTMLGNMTVGRSIDVSAPNATSVATRNTATAAASSSSSSSSPNDGVCDGLAEVMRQLMKGGTKRKKVEAIKRLLEAVENDDDDDECDAKQAKLKGRADTLMVRDIRYTR